MQSPGHRAARTMAKPVKVLLPSSPHRLGIPDELAQHLDGRGGGDFGDGGMALVVSPFGKVWRLEVERDSEGAFLARGWPEFAAVHGIGVGWFLMLRHEGGGVLTLKAFDPTCCLKEFGRPLTVTAARSSTDGARRPQFIKVPVLGFMEKMLIPAEFVKRYVSEEQLNTRMAILSSSIGKFCRVELEKVRFDVFFAGGWPQFLALHDITENDALLLRYEGNMMFTVKAFGPNGCQKEFELRKVEQQDIKLEKAQHQTFVQTRSQQEEAPSSSRKRKSRNQRQLSVKAFGPKGCQKEFKELNIKIEQDEQQTSVKTRSQQEEAPSSSRKRKNRNQRQPSVSVYDIGPPSWIKKEMNTYALERHLTLSSAFCNAIGFQKHCTITLRAASTSGGGASGSWQVRGLVYKKHVHYLGDGWRRFCKDNKLKVGDVCTFNVIKTELWSVVVTRY